MDYHTKPERYYLIMSIICIIGSIGCYLGNMFPNYKAVRFIIVGFLLIMSLFFIVFSFIPMYRYSIDKDKLIVSTVIRKFIFPIDKILSIMDLEESGYKKNSNLIPPEIENVPKGVRYDFRHQMIKREDLILLVLKNEKGIHFLWISPVKKKNFLSELINTIGKKRIESINDPGKIEKIIMSMR